MKLVLELKGNPTENDIIIYRDGEWKIISKNAFIDDLEKEIKILTDTCDSLKKELSEFKGAVNNKLKEYHDVLQVLTEGGNE